MTTREATCHCGQLRLEVDGEPFAVALCSCDACQRRTGSAFGLQAGFRADQVRIEGRASRFSRVSEETDRREHVFHFCPECGSTVYHLEPVEPDQVVVSVGCFADPTFTPPASSGYDSRRHPWIGLPDTVARHAPELWDPVRPLYADGRYAEAADLGVALIAAHPGHALLLFNTACCESRAGRTEAALEHLTEAIALWDGCRGLAAGDDDLADLRALPRFQALTEGG